MSGGLEFLKDSIGLLKQNCVTELELNVSRWEHGAESDHPRPPASIMNTLCPDDCSGHGSCLNGQ